MDEDQEAGCENLQARGEEIFIRTNGIYQHYVEIGWMLGVAQVASSDVITCAAYLNGCAPSPRHQVLLDELKRSTEELITQLDLLRAKATLKED